MFKAMRKKSTVVKRGPLDHTKIGLVKENMFPLYNEDYVINAISFFDHCPVNKRLELATNINEQLKNLNITIEIPESSSFYKYSNKNIVKKKVVLEVFAGTVTQERIDACCNGDPFIKTLITKIQDWKLTDLSSLRDLETYIVSSADVARDKNTAVITNGPNLINVFHVINAIMKDRYEGFYSKLKYVDNTPVTEDRVRFNNLIIKVLDDIFFLIKNRIEDGKTDPLFIKEKIDLVLDMYKTLNFNGFVINRYLYEAMMDVVITVTQHEEKDSFYEIEKLFESSMVIKVDNDINKLLISDTFIINTFNLVDSSFIQSSKYLEKVKKMVGSEVKSILMTDLPLVTTPNDGLVFNVKDIICKTDGGMLSILSSMEGSMHSKNIKFYNKDYSLLLNDIDLLFITEKLKHKYFEVLYPSHCRTGNIIYFGIKEHELYLFGKSADGYLAISLYHNRYAAYSRDAYMNFMVDKPISPLKIFKISPIDGELKLDSLTEGISISKDGTVKFVFNKNMKYMDEYDKAHKQLEANWKAKNYEGMKQNISFLFTLVLNIEREYIHTDKKIDEVKKADAVKARMFAINDFKSYLIKLKAVEPNFDFTKYYEENGYDKISVSVDTDTMLGIKKIFQMIMMG